MAFNIADKGGWLQEQKGVADKKIRNRAAFHLKSMAPKNSTYMQLFEAKN
jgi:hypothetical protein